MVSLLWLLLAYSVTTAETMFYRVYNGDVGNFKDIQPGNPADLYQNLDPLKVTVFFFHGWNENCGNDSAITMCSAILSHDGYNVCCFDWRELSNNFYPTASSNTQAVAATVAQDVNGMYILGLKLEKVIIYGFSLGAHIAGCVGKNVQAAGNPKIGTIFGIDAAGPLWYPVVLCLGCRRLEPTDATMVYNVHTSGGSFGGLEATALCDIYVNGGYPIQNGCPIASTTFDPNQPLKTPRCSHDRAYLYVAEAIRIINSHICVFCDSGASFIAGLCLNNPRLSIGMEMPKNVAGKCFYTTRAAPTWGQGQQGTIPPSKLLSLIG